MSEFILFATLAGFICGVLHAAHILLRHHQLPGGSAYGPLVYRALWAVLLWTAFGAYLIVFWILGFVLRLLIRRGARV